MAYTRVDWEDLPSTGTPINATNLNNMDAGTKENDEILSGTKAINNTIYANDFVCKNMLNKYVWLNGYYMSNGSFNPANSSCTFDYIEVKPNTTYTISLASSVRYLGYYSFNSSKNYINGVFAEYTNTYTFTTDANTYYIKVAFSYDDSTTITQSMIDGLTPQLELGSQATPYIPHKDFENEEIYSTEEIVIGKWIDGRPLYRKVFITTSPSSGSGAIISLPSNVNVIFMSGIVLVSNNYRVPINTYASSTDNITLYTDDYYNVVNCACGSGYSNCPMHVCIEYVKSTDSSRGISTGNEQQRNISNQEEVEEETR